MAMRKLVGLLCSLSLLCGVVFGQAVTGNIIGTVTDPSNAAVPNVEAQIKDVATGAVRTASSSTEGIFRFPNLPPGRYTLTIKLAGFKTYTQEDIGLTVNETRDLGRIVLALGSTTEEVTVSATVTPVQTASSEKGAVVSGEQLNRISLKGRDLIVLLNTLPGVYVNTGAFAAETTSEDGIRQVSINGAQTGKANFLVDGIVDLDSGSYQTTHYEPNMDSVAEIKVLTSNYQAEFGRSAGGTIALVTKSGSQQFHGSVHATKRHEMFNAKTFFENFNNQQKAKYRFFIGGFGIGGPAYIPKLFNRDKQRFFFFVSQEYTKQRSESGYVYAQAPTALERNGDFSQSLDSTGRVYPIVDPITRQPIPNYVIPKSQANPAGLSMMNFYPLPNRCGASGAGSDCWNESDPTQINRRNYRIPYAGTHPRRNDVIRIDGRATEKISGWWRYINDYDLQQTSFNVGLLNSENKWEPYSEDHPNPGHGHGLGVTYIISPNLVNEASFGRSYNTWDWYPHDPSQLDRKRMSNPPHWFDEKDPNFTKDGNSARPNLPPGAQNFAVWVPQVTGGTMSVSNGNRPYTNWNNEYSFSDSLTWVKGAHSLKAGFAWEKVEKVQQAGTGTYLGSYNFSHSSSWPYSTGYGNANMYLGNFQNYSEGMRVMGDFWFTGLEAFVQDNWRVSRRLTVDAGVRFYHLAPQENTNYTSAVWWFPAYDPSKAARLYQQGCKVTLGPTGACPTASQVAVDPRTGQTTWAALANTFVPGSGDYFNGMQVAGVSKLVPLSLFSVPAVSPALRIGLAWDVFGDGRTAIRTGFGQFLQRGDGNQIMNQAGTPPIAYNRQIYYSSISQLAAQAGSAAVTPISNPSLVGSQKYESSYSASFGIQQDVGFGTVLDVAYVGAFYRHGLRDRQANAIPMYAQYDPQYADPWSPYNPRRSVNDNNLRPLPGLGAITLREFSASRNYNSLQVSARRHMRNGLAYGLAYTFSKIMSAGNPSPYWSDESRNRGPSYNGAPHFLTFNYIYDLPKLGKRLGFRPLGWITDNWTISGFTTLTSHLMYGLPGCCSFSNTSTSNPSPVFTGSYEGARMIVVGNPSVPSGQVTSDLTDWTKNNTFNWKAFTYPYPCSWTPGATPQQGIGRSVDCFGNAGPGSLMSMPLRQNNWDMTFAKNFPLGRESSRILTFRAEMYNIWNHTQFSSINTSIQYDLPQWQRGNLVQTNNQLGRYNGVRDPRRMAMTLRLEF